MTVRSGYGGTDGKIVDMRWDNNLDDSPWLFDTINDYLWDIRDTMKNDGVYILQVTFRNYRLWSKVIKMITMEN